MWQPFLFGYAKACSDKGTTQKTHAFDENGRCAQSMDISLGHMLIHSVKPMRSLKEEENFHFDHV